MLRTMSHEMIHMAKQMSPGYFERYSDFIFDNFLSENADELIFRRQRQYEKANNGKKLSYNEAMEEVVADASEMFLKGFLGLKVELGNQALEGRVDMETVTEDLQKPKYKGVLRILGNVIERMKRKISAFKRAWNGAQAKTEEGKTVSAGDAKAYKQAQKMFNELILRASANYKLLKDGKWEIDSEKSEKASMRNGETDGTAQADITAGYQAAVGKVLNMKNTKADTLIIGYTPELMQEMGMPALPLVIGTGHVYSAAKTEAQAKQDGNYRKGVHYHGLGADVVKNIYEQLKDPVIIISAKDVNKTASPLRSTHSVVSIVDVGKVGKPLLLPVEITAERTVNGQRMDVNALSSIYDRNVAPLIKEAIALENSGYVGIYYAKKEAINLIGAGVRFPVQLQEMIASNPIIHRFDTKVNRKIENNTQSQQFKRWFGDWQNNPESASKVVNADGTPMAVYHQTARDFTVFDNSNPVAGASDSETPNGFF